MFDQPPHILIQHAMLFLSPDVVRGFDGCTHDLAVDEFWPQK